MKHNILSGIKRSLLASLIFLIGETIYGQMVAPSGSSRIHNSGDEGISSLVEKQTEYLESTYLERIETPEELINGKEYESYYTRSKVKPLLFPERARTSSVITKTRKYYGLSLQYDTYLDEVIYTDTSKMINFRYPQIALNKNKIEGFNLYFKDDSMAFRYFRLPDCSARNLREGFYEVAYEGATQFLIRHKSEFYEKEGLYNYKYTPIRYISSGKGFYPVKSKKNLLRLMGNNSKEVKKYIHASGIRIRQADKDQIIIILKFYDSLSGAVK